MKPIMIHMPDDLIYELDRIAEEFAVSRAQIIRSACREHVHNYECPSWMKKSVRAKAAETVNA